MQKFDEPFRTFMIIYLFQQFRLEFSEQNFTKFLVAILPLDSDPFIFADPDPWKPNKLRI